MTNLSEPSAEDQAEAERWLRSLIEDRHPERHWGTGGETYDTVNARAEGYMVGGGGPTGWLWFILEADEDDPYDESLSAAFLHFTSGGGAPVLAPVPVPQQGALLLKCRADSAARLARG